MLQAGLVVSPRTEPAARLPATVRRRVAVGLAEGLLLTVLAALGYYQMFSLFVLYDDEGYMMLLVKHVLAGHQLYDEVRTFYGPVYFFYKWLVHGLGGLPLTHDVVRLTALVVRLLTGLVAAASAFGFTASASLAAAAQMLVTFHLITIQSEPGHPQELCGLLTMLMVAIPSVARGCRPGAIPAALGLLVAALAMTKVNLGAFTAIAISMAFLSSVPLTRVSAALRIVSFAALVALPWALMRPLLGTPPTLHFAATETLALAAISAVALTRRSGTSSLRELAIFVAAAAGGTALIAFTLFAWGGSAAALVDNVVVTPSRLPFLFVYMPPHIVPASWIPVLTALAAAALAVGVRATEGSRRAAHVVGFGQLAFGVAALTASWRLDFPMLLSGLTPFLWLGLLPPAGAAPNLRQPLARRVLCWIAVLEPLQAFPAAGSQAYFGTVTHVLVGVVCLGDGLNWLRSLSGGLVRRGLAAMPTAVALLVAASAVWQLHLWRTLYATLVPADLPGAARLRLPAERVALLHTLTQTLRERSDTFLCVPGFNSLYFWTGEDPPTLDVTPVTIRVHSDERQAAMLDALLEHPRPMAVHFKGLADPYPPFEDRLRQSFTPLMKVGTYQLLVPRRAPSDGQR